MSPGSEALVVLDAQAALLRRHASADGTVHRLAEAIQTARASQVPIVYVKTAFRPGFPEVSAHNKAFAAMVDRGGMDERELAIVPELAPLPAEPIVIKSRVSAFVGTDLGVLLRSMGIRTLVLAGVSTSGVILSTVRHAADLDYRLTVLQDACADADPAAHQFLIGSIFPRQADVIPTAQWAPARATAL